MKNLLISGDIGVGKSYLLRKALERYNGSLGGFITGKDYVEGGHYIYMKSLNDFYSSVNVAHVVDGLDIYSAQVYSHQFDEYGTQFIDEAITSRQLVVMDEIGVMERNSPKFLNSIERAFSSDKPVVGIIKNRKSPILETFKSRKDTKTLFITGQNSDEVYNEVIHWMEKHQLSIKTKRKHEWSQKKIDMYERALDYGKDLYPGPLLKSIFHQTNHIKDKSWLELGVGTGAFSIPIGLKSKSLTAVDTSYNMLLNFSDKIRRLNIRNSKGLLVPIELLNTDTKYDYVLSSFSGSALSHTDNLTKFIDMAKEKAFILCPADSGDYNFKGDVLARRLHRHLKPFSGGAGPLKEQLEQLGYEYQYTEIDFNLPQVFNTMEECVYFFKELYGVEEDEEEILRSFVLEYLKEDQHYYVFDNHRKAGLFTIISRVSH